MWNRLTRTLFSNEKKSEITAENNAEFFIISDVKLIKQKHSHTVFIDKFIRFIELEGIDEIYLRFFFKFEPSDLSNSMQ